MFSVIKHLAKYFDCMNEGSYATHQTFVFDIVTFNPTQFTRDRLRVIQRIAPMREMQSLESFILWVCIVQR